MTCLRSRPAGCRGVVPVCGHDNQLDAVVSLVPPQLSEFEPVSLQIEMDLVATTH